MDVDQPAFTTLEAEPKKEKKKKRKSEDMDVDEDEDDHSSKKVKLSKEEKKALKKAKKEQAKTEAVADDDVRFQFYICEELIQSNVPNLGEIIEEGEEREEREKGKEGKEEEQRVVHHCPYASLFSLFPFCILAPLSFHFTPCFHNSDLSLHIRICPASSS
jgi:hypothetical protein